EATAGVEEARAAIALTRGARGRVRRGGRGMRVSIGASSALGEQIGKSSRFEQVIQLAKYGITPDYIRRVREVGLTDLTFDQVIAMGKYGVDPEDVAAFREMFGEQLSTEDVIRFSKYGVDREYVRRLTENGIADFTPDELIRMAKYGVDPDLVREYREMDVADLDFDGDDQQEGSEDDGEDG
ncbi:MAG TPA: hypothetical protein VM840_06815, partial [Actinomycetota bacterium]|nr:hypothetical protein [Actinomycetota bacterium]